MPATFRHRFGGCAVRAQPARRRSAGFLAGPAARRALYRR